MERTLSALSAIVIIVAGVIYITHQLDAYAAKNAADKLAMERIVAEAEATKHTQDDYTAWALAHSKPIKEPDGPCIKAVNKLRSIEMAKASNVVPFYKDDPTDLRTQITACVAKGKYTSAQVADVLN